MANEISIWLDFALQQLAAESHLHGIDDFADIETVKARLVDGANRFDAPVPPPTEHPTRMTEEQAKAFTDRYEVADHQPNDASGFSATLLREKAGDGTLTDSYTLALRSTEFRDRMNGGDYERDGAVFDLALGTLTGADGELVEMGFALAQLASMEAYYADEVKPLLPPGATLNVTGYSLGGHLATVFTELHTADVNHTYIFNGAGRGDFDSDVGDLAAMVAYYRARLADPGSGPVPDPLDPYRDMWEAAMAFADAPAPSNEESWYRDPRHQWALVETQRRFDTQGLGDSHESSARSGVSAKAAGKITQLFGHATHDDQEIVANSGINAPPTSVFIEDQPDVTGGAGLWGLPGNFGTTHSIVLMIDSLSVMDAFQAVDGRLEQDDIESILAAASRLRAENSLLPVGRAEADSLELALDALRKIIIGPHTFAPTPFVDGTLGFGDLPTRQRLHQNISELKAAAASTKDLTITNITTLMADELAAKAKTTLAYRHALVELNPFVLEGDDSLYTSFNAAGRLDALTDHYIDDRAAFLSLVLAENTDPETFDAAQATDRFYEDRDSGRLIGESGAARPHVRFGDERSEELGGAGGADHLYGHGGADVLHGGSGDDLLDGGPGEDALTGGAGYDSYHVSAGDTVHDSDGVGRVFWGEVPLAGGDRIGQTPYFRSRDGEFIYRREGPASTMDVFRLKHGAAIRVLAHHDGELGITLAGVESPPTPVNVLEGTAQADDVHIGSISYPGPYDLVRTHDGADVVSVRTGVYRGMRVDTGAGDDIVRLGIDAAGVGDVSGLGAKVETGTGDDFIDGGLGADHVDGGTGHDSVFGNAGADLLIGHQGNDWLDGQTDNDAVFGAAGADMVLGGGGDDFLAGGSGNDELYGDAAGLLGVWDGAARTIRTLQSSPVGGVFALMQESAAAGNDILDGGEGLDRLYGGAGNDLLRGGAGSDRIEGENGDDVLDGGAGADVLYGDLSSETYERDNGLVSSGAADDGTHFTIQFRQHQGLVPPGGNDVLRGGDGRDTLYGQDGDDELDGGRDDDTLDGGLGDDIYVFDRGGGRDNINDEGGTDHIRVGRGIAPNDLALYSRDGTLELQVLSNGLVGGAQLPVLGDDALSVLRWDEASHRVESIAFADGTVWETAGPAFDFDEHELSDPGSVSGASGITTYRLDPTLANGFNLTIADAGGRDTLFLERAQLDLPPELGPKFITPEIESVCREGQDLLLDVFMQSDLVRPDVRGRLRLAGYYTETGWIETIASADGVLAPPKNAPVVVNPPDDVAVDIDAPFSVELPENMFSDDLLDAFTLRASLANGLPLPHWLGFDPATRRLEGLATVEQISVLPIVVSATDRSGLSATTLFELRVGNADIAPEVSRPLPNVATPVGAEFLFEIPAQTFTDSDVRDTLSVAVMLADGRPLPPWLSFDPGTNELAGIPRAKDEGLLGLTVVATDQSGLTATTGFLLAVVPEMPTGETLFGTDGEDVLEALDTPDLVLALAGADEIFGFAGDDILHAGPGNDLVIAGRGDDHITGAAGDDNITGDGGHDRLLGGPGNDTLFGQGGHDLLNGGAGDDLLAGGPEDDRLVDIEGDDTYQFSAAFGVDQVQDLGGLDVVAFSGVTGVSRCDDGFCDTTDEVESALQLTTVYRVGVNLALDFPNESRVLLQDWFSGPEFKIESFDFTSSDTEPFMRLGPAAVETYLDRQPSFATLGTSGNDLISVTPNASSLSSVVFALSGDDTVEGRGPTRMVAFGGEGRDRIEGSRRADDLIGGEGDDYLIGFSGNDTIVGGPGDDVLTGSPDLVESFVVDRAAGDDTYYFEAGDGSDFLLDPSGANHLQFAAGIGLGAVTVRYVVGPERDYRESFDLAIEYGMGDRVVTPFWTLSLLGELMPAAGIAEGPTRISDATTYGFGGGSTLDQTQLLDLITMTATAGADVLIGTAAADRFAGDGGDDFLFGLAGQDELRGGAGDDRLYGGAHDDVLAGGEGDDVLEGGAGVDTLSGGLGADVLDGGAGGGVFSGGRGNDLFRLSSDAAVVRDSGGLDTLEFSYAANLTAPVEAVPVLRQGDDLMVNLGGSTRVEGWFASPDNRIENFRFPVDDGEGGSTFVSRTGDEIAALAVTPNGSPVLSNPLPDQVAQAEILFRFEFPADTFSDPEGDALKMSVGAVDGGQLPEWMGFDAATNILSGTPPGGEGETSIVVTATDKEGLSATESFVLSVVAAGPVSGSRGDDVLTGTLSDDVLAGRRGDDVIYGGFGDDELHGGRGGDRLHGEAGDDDLVGGKGADLLVGGSGNDALSGNSQADILDGGNGNDRLRGHQGSDSLFGGGGDDMLDGGSGIDVLSGGDGDDTLRGGSGADVLQGEAGDDALHGGAGADFLAGGLGRDRLAGGRGSDSYLVERGGAQDTLVEMGGSADVLHFGAGINNEQLWFTRLNDDLHVDIVGTHDGISIEGWYRDSRSRVEEIHTDDGAVLVESQVAKLVDAMAAFEPPAANDLTLPGELLEYLEPAIAASWQVS